MLSKRILILVFVFVVAFLFAGCFPTTTPPNEAPIITSSPITTATVGVLYTYDVNATDPDGDTLTYSLDLKPSGMTINSANGLIKWTPIATQVGNNSVTVKVSDGTLSVIQSFTIKVSKPPTVNLAPTIYSTPVTTATVGVTYFYNVNATDPNGDILAYSLTTYPSGMAIGSASGLIMWTPVATQVGNNSVIVKVSDGVLSDTQGFTIKVSVVEPGLTGIVVVPKTMPLIEGESQPITSVTAHYDDGSTAPIASGFCTYVSSATGVATVSNGVVTAVTEGIAIITVSYGGKSDTVTVTVSVVPPTIVTLAAIHEVIAPVTDATPVTTIMETPQYTGSVVWNPAEDPFQLSEVYTATITLTPKTGYTLTGVIANFFTVFGATIVTNAVDSGVVEAEFPETVGVQLTITDLILLTLSKPYDGNTTATVTAGTLIGVVSPDDVTVIATATYDTKDVGTDKTITVVYTLGGSDAGDYIKPVDYAVTDGVITAAVINIAAIPGVDAPVIGGTPDTEITPTAQYTGVVTWLPVATTFAGEQIYTATITLTPKTGYILTGVIANFFTVFGATIITNAVDSGVVEAEFPVTEAPAVINFAAIPGVEIPVTGAIPVTEIIPTAQYTGVVIWLPVHTTFAGEQSYVATITLTAKAGYTLTGVTADFFTVAGAITPLEWWNRADLGVVEARFPDTGPED